MKFRILGFAPNETIQNHFYTIAEKYPEILMDAYISNSYQGLELLKSKSQENYDLILARGETASMLKKVAKIPVIEIPFSQDSILHAIKLAETFQEKYAIVGYTAVTSTANRLKELLSLNLDIYTIHDIGEAAKVITSLKEQGYSIIISGLCIDYLIIQQGLKHIGITSKYEDIESIFRQMFPLIHFYLEQNQQLSFFSKILDYIEDDIMVIRDNDMVFSSIKTLEETTAHNLAFKAVQNHSGNYSVSERIGKNIHFRITCRSYAQNDSTFYVVTIVSKKLKVSLQKNELLYYSCADAATIFLKHFNEIFFSAYQFSFPLPQIIASGRPVFLFGEHGTGKEQLAAYIYTQSTLKNHPYIVVDLKLFSERSWSFLLTGISSPLNDNDCTIYFRSLEDLSAVRLEHLICAIRDSRLCSRNRIIFSYACKSGKNIPDSVFRLQNTLDCITVNLAPLRERADSIPTLAKLYISTLNIECSKQVIGFYPDALEYLQSYPWEHNLAQFKRVLSQLVESCSGAYITLDSVKQILKSEHYSVTAPGTSNVPFDLRRSLHDIEVDIVKSVVSDLGGNQTKAAKQLGICRTTLWKLLNS
ncbi:MAG TPA: PrpR N-terminal domain-containing protein [Candidatus Cottocaccamicrobium excrementipullorum]|nr:PrpR N-terminal domain-containing protein [Candidatus Cottocaccamicrobium excrementipullorum]